MGKFFRLGYICLQNAASLKNGLFTRILRYPLYEIILIVSRSEHVTPPTPREVARQGLLENMSI